MRPLGIVADQVAFQVFLHLLQGFTELLALLDAQVLLKQGSVKPSGEPIALTPADLGGAVLDLFLLQEQLIGVSLRPAAELSAMIGQHGVNPGLMSFKEGQDSWLSPWPRLPLIADCQVNTITLHIVFFSRRRHTRRRSFHDASYHSVCACPQNQAAYNPELRRLPAARSNAHDPPDECPSPADGLL